MGLVLARGDSCSYPGGGMEFTVTNDGSGRVRAGGINLVSGSGHDLRGANLNGRVYNFVASKRSDGRWIIEVAG